MRPTPAGADRALRMLRTCLGDGRALPFAEAVLRQVAQPLGARRDAGRALVASRVICDLLERAGPGATGDPQGEIAARQVAVLAEDPVLLAAFFQNVDLLYRTGAPEAERVGTWVMAAVESVGIGEAGAVGERARHADEEPA